MLDRAEGDELAVGFEDFLQVGEVDVGCEVSFAGVDEGIVEFVVFESL